MRDWTAKVEALNELFGRRLAARQERSQTETAEWRNLQLSYSAQLPHGGCDAKLDCKGRILNGGVWQAASLTASAQLDKIAATGTQVVSQGWQFDTRSGELTKIPDAILNDLKQFQLMALAYFTTPTTFVIDRTVYNVSPN
jgi:hypothetical protein